MYLFKYYRPDFLFDKAIRYNELYFSAPAQLNDPNDLNIVYRFDNGLNFWTLLLNSQCEYSHKDLSQILDLNKLNIQQGLNRIFRSKRIKSNLEALDELFDDHRAEIQEILYDNMNHINIIDPKIYGAEPNPRQFLVTLCEQSIKERLYKKIVPAICSVSFSSKALNSMMWAHYTAGFSGCVVIYKAKQSIHDKLPYMELKDNLLSMSSFKFDIKPIKYSNQTKEVSLLDPRSDTAELFCIKNRFWNYESEYRMSIAEKNIGIANERSTKKHVNRNLGHIFHHETSAIQGIIFGPRMSSLKKEEIWQVIKSNMEIRESELCYFFDAELSLSGKIKISSGQQAKKNQGKMLSKNKISEANLPNILKELGITN
ncbi:DUF2971 domain-containing protein [Providencia rettgeri]|uniref:DUF2971 domain-containing protein n=1 Tax=Providencia rettgeri TaxID=587 RepID=UPI0023604A1E|nr:DUF2971 domain-containing protein [Providencia rettgeri]